MQRNGDIVRYTAEELEEMRRRGESRTDWAKVDAMTEEELEASIAADPDDVHEELDWTLAYPGPPPPDVDQEDMHLCLDADLIDWFKAQGQDYQAHINAVLRAFVQTKKLAEARKKNAA